MRTFEHLSRSGPNEHSTLATSVTVPAIPLLQEAFNLSRTEATLPLTLFTLGIAVGPLFIAPLSETLGRRWVYIGTCTCFLAFTAGAGASTTFAGLLVCRFFAAFLGSAGLAMVSDSVDEMTVNADAFKGGGTVADLWALEKVGRGPALLFILGPFLGPTLGPLAGAYILHEYNERWRFSQWVILMVGAPIYLGILCMQETSKAQILKPKREPGTLTKAHAWARTKHHFRNGVLRPSRMLVTEPIVLSLTIYTAYAYAMIFSFFGSLPYILELEYGFNSRQVGLAFLSVIIGYCLANVMFGAFDMTLYAKARRAAGGMPAPEHRLYSGMVGSIFIPVGLFWYAWAAHRGGHWAAVVASGIPFGFGAFALFLSTISYLVDTYQAGLAASALAANGILRYTFGAVFPLFTVQMYTRLGIHWAGSVFAFLSLLLLPIPWILFKYGKALRMKSHFETSHL